jgi:hypothetical protein
MQVVSWNYLILKHFQMITYSLDIDENFCCILNLLGHSTEWRKGSHHFCDFRAPTTLHTDEWHIIIGVNELRWLNQGNDRVR